MQRVLYSEGVIECLINNSYFFYADFSCLSIFSVGRDYVTFIVVVCNFVVRYKTNSVNYSFLTDQDLSIVDHSNC